jgi:hypothetical protein
MTSLHCDIQTGKCDEFYQGKAGDDSDSVQIRKAGKANGWLRVTIDGVRKDVCPSCAEECADDPAIAKALARREKTAATAKE